MNVNDRRLGRVREECQRAGDLVARLIHADPERLERRGQRCALERVELEVRRRPRARDLVGAAERCVDHRSLHHPRPIAGLLDEVEQRHAEQRPPGHPLLVDGSPDRIGPVQLVDVVQVPEGEQVSSENGVRS